jgi:glucose-1-phosphate thymidylyltransferase
LSSATRNSRWADEYRAKRRHCPKITVVNDHSTDDSNKLGAIGDIKLVVDSRKVDDDLLIIGGDNLFKESLRDLVVFAGKHGATLGVYDVGSLDEIKKYGAVSADGDGRITFFEEKPKNPHTTLAAMCLYFYPREVLPKINEYVRDGNNPDQPGRFVAWLHKQHPVFSFQIHGKWLDIGSFESLDQANREFA